MKLQDWLAVERGRGAALAISLGASPVLISQWGSGTRMPPIERCIPIERATNGEVTCEELRPDRKADFAYLRNLHQELPVAQQTQAQAAPETVANSADALPQIQDLPPIAATPAAPVWDGIDRRSPVSKPLPPDLERRAALANYTGV